MTENLRRNLVLFSTGGLAYGGIELLWRQRTHWSMVLTGGICFLSLYKLYEKKPHLSIPEKCVLGSCVITAVEFAVGCIVNLGFGWKVWDYSSMPVNLLGQICLLYSVLWGMLCIPVSKLCAVIQKIFNKIDLNKKVRT